MGAGSALAGAVLVAAVHDHEDRREERHHAQPRDQDGHGRDGAQLLDAAEVGQREDEEGARGGEGPDEHPGPGAGRGQLERLAQVAAEEDLLLVAEEVVDAVVDPDADHDRDEHDREQGQVPDDQGHEPHGPREGHRQDPQHQDRLAHPHERERQHHQGEGEGQHVRDAAVVEGRGHLVVGERGRAGDAGLHVREGGPQPRDGLADGLDGGLVAGEAALLAGRRLDQDEQQALVLGEEVARVRGRVLAEREEGAPGRAVGNGVLQAARHLVQQHAQEARVHRQVLLLQADVEEVRHEGGRHLGVDALEQAGQARVAREALHELLVVEDLVADLPQFRSAQVEELAALEAFRIDPVGDAVELDGAVVQLVGEADCVGPRALEGAGLHHDHDVLELAELLGELRVALHVAGVLGQERAGGGLEGEGVGGIGDGDGGQQERDADRDPGPAARQTDKPAQETAGARDSGHERPRPRDR